MSLNFGKPCKVVKGLEEVWASRHAKLLKFLWLKSRILECIVKKVEMFNLWKIVCHQRQTTHICCKLCLKNTFNMLKIISNLTCCVRLSRSQCEKLFSSYSNSNAFLLRFRLVHNVGGSSHWADGQQAAERVQIRILILLHPSVNTLWSKAVQPLTLLTVMLLRLQRKANSLIFA